MIDGIVFRAGPCITVTMKLSLIDSAAAGSFAIALATQLWISAVPPTRVFQKWILFGIFVIFAAVSYSAFGLLYNQTNPLLERVADLDNIITNISDITECKKINNIRSTIHSKNWTRLFIIRWCWIQ